MALESVLDQVKATNGILDLGTIATGITKGYTVASGIELSTVANAALLSLPLLAKTGVGGYLGLVEGVSDEDNSSYAPFVAKRGILGLGIGAAELAIGYAIGYTFGGLSK